MSIVSPTDITDAKWRVAITRVVLQRARREQVRVARRVALAEEAFAEAKRALAEVSASSC